MIEVPTAVDQEMLLAGLVGDLGFKVTANVVPGGSNRFTVFQSNPKRHGFLVHWFGTTVGFLSPDPAVNLNTGITLGQGTLLRFFLRDDGIVVTYPWYVFTSAVNTNMFVIEYLVL